MKSPETKNSFIVLSKLTVRFKRVGPMNCSAHIRSSKRNGFGDLNFLTSNGPNLTQLEQLAGFAKLRG